MEELYWITVLGNISLLCCVVASVGATAAIAVTLVLYGSEWEPEEEKRRKTLESTMTALWFVSFLTLTCAIFIPSKKELYIIYGVGSTIDYLKENPTAQGLPEKYIKVLDKIADEKLEEEK